MIYFIISSSLWVNIISLEILLQFYMRTVTVAHLIELILDYRGSENLSLNVTPKDKCKVSVTFDRKGCDIRQIRTIKHLAK